MHKVTPALLPLLLLLSAPLSAQWIPLTTGTTADLYTVERVDDTTVYAAGQNVFLKSLNGGQSWTSIPFVNTSNQPISSLTVQDLHFFTPGVGIAVGAQANTIRVILRTTDGGQHWTVVHSSNDPGGWEGGFRKVQFIDAQNGWCIGSSGRIMKTANGGQTWTVQQDLNLYSHLQDVYFVNAQTGYLTAEINYNTFSVGHYLKTTDGGQSWNLLLSSGPIYTDVFFVTPQIGYIVQGPYLFRISDGQINFAQASFPDDATALELRFFSENAGYALTAGSVRKTTDGGQFWQVSNLPPAAGQDMLHFDWSDDGLTGYVVGKKGKAYKTGTGGAPYEPNAFFTTSINGGFCPDSLFECLNPAPEADFSSTWFVDNVLYATTNDLTLSFPDYGATHTITLVLSNGMVSDTFSRTITMESALPDFDIELEWITPPPLCEGNSLEFRIKNPVVQQSYFVYINGQYHTQQLAYTADPLVFSTPPLYDTSVISVQVPLYNACETKTIANTLIAEMIPSPDPGLSWSAPSAVCVGDSAVITIFQSEANMQYQLFWNNIPVSPATPGNGGNLSFSTFPLLNGGAYEVEASFQGLCARRLNQSLGIQIEYFYDQLDTAQTFAVVGQPVTLYNPTNDLGSVTWTFGPPATPQQSQAFGPTVAYGASGAFPYTYSYQSTGICSGVKSGTFEVFDAAADLPGTFCTPQLLPNLHWETVQRNHAVLDAKVDANGNVLVTGASYQQVAWWPTMNLYLRKYDPSGYLLWEKNTNPQAPQQGLEYRSSYGTALATDPEGNIYLAGSYAADKAIILGQTFITALNDNFPFGQGFLMKLSPAGDVLWTIRLQALTGSRFCIPSDLIWSALDGDLHVALHAKNWQAELPNGSTAADDNATARLWYLRFDTAGNYVSHAQLGSMGVGVQPGGRWHPETGNLFNNLVTYTSPELRETTDGRLVFTGTYSVLDSLSEPVFGSFPAAPLSRDLTGNVNHFAAVYNRNTAGWTSAFCPYAVGGPGLNYVQPRCALTPDDALVVGFGLADALYNALPVITATVHTGPALQTLTRNRSIIGKFDLSGNLLWNITGSPMHWHSLEADAKGNLWALAGYYTAAGFFDTAAARDGVAALGGKDVLLAQVNADGSVAGLHTYGTTANDQPAALLVGPDGRISTLAASGLDVGFSASPLTNLTLYPYSPDDACPVVSAKEPERRIMASLSPNPATGQFTLSLEDQDWSWLQVLVLDTRGSVVSTQSFPAHQAGKINVPLTGPAGLYYVQLRTDKGVYSGKVVKAGE